MIWVKNQMKRYTHEVQKGLNRRASVPIELGSTTPMARGCVHQPKALWTPYLWDFMEVSLCLYLCVCMLSHFSPVGLFATPWTVARGSLSLGFSRQEYWSGLPCPPVGDLPDPESIPASLLSLLPYQVGILPLVTLEKLPFMEDGTLKIVGYSKLYKTDKNREFLGLIGYCRHWVLKFSEIVKFHMIWLNTFFTLCPCNCNMQCGLRISILEYNKKRTSEENNEASVPKDRIFLFYIYIYIYILIKQQL